MTDEDLLGRSEDDEEDDGDYTNTSTYTIITGTQCGDDEDFKPDLPFKCGNQTQTALEKELVVEVDKTEGKSEKIVPMTAATSSESKMDSDPSPIVQQFLVLAKEVNATPPIMALAKNANVTTPVSDVGASLDDKDQQIRLTKKHYKEVKHIKSGIFFLPLLVSLNNEGMKSGLPVDYTERASQNACGATYQRCYTEVPMKRFGSLRIDDLQPMKIIY